MTIGERIAKARKEKNLSQEYLAELLEVSRQAVSKWETNLTEPDTGNLIQLARILNVSVEYLASGEQEKQKVVYVEKNIPIFKIFGIIFTSLGALSSILGFLMPFMFGIAVFCVGFGVLLIILKKEGLILSGIIVALGTALFIIQGFMGGIDTPIMWLIAAISVGLPILTYAIIKLVKKIKQEEKIKKLKDNPLIIKRIIFVLLISAILIAAIAIPANIEAKKRRSAFEKAKFFSSERLSEFMIADLPSPTDIDCINLNSQTILLNADSDEGIEYLERIYNYLISKNFNYLGTRGRVTYADKGSRVYCFIPHDKGYYYGPYKHYGFNSNEAPDDYYFVYSNSIMNEVNGEIECCVIHVKRLDQSMAVVDGKRYSYNTMMTVYRESALEGYKFPTYNIEYVENSWGDDINDLLLQNQPTFSLPDKEIKIRIKPSDMNFDLYFDGGKAISRTCVTDEYWEYTFIMPEYDVKILIMRNEY